MVWLSTLSPLKPVRPLARSISYLRNYPTAPQGLPGDLFPSQGFLVLSFPLERWLGRVPCAACPVQRALHSVPATACPPQHALRSVLCAACSAQRALRSVPCARACAACPAQRALRSVPEFSGEGAPWTISRPLALS
jgi:hypothetical protein